MFAETYHVVLSRTPVLACLGHTHGSDAKDHPRVSSSKPSHYRRLDIPLQLSRASPVEILLQTALSVWDLHWICGVSDYLEDFSFWHIADSDMFRLVLSFWSNLILGTVVDTLQRTLFLIDEGYQPSGDIVNVGYLSSACSRPKSSLRWRSERQSGYGDHLTSSSTLRLPG